MARFILSLTGLLVGLVAYAGAAVADEAATKEEVRQAAAVLDQAFVDRNVPLILSMMTEDNLSSTPFYRKAATVAEQLDTLGEFKAEIFDVTNERVDFLGEGAAVVTFEKSYRGTFNGEPLPERVFASSLWENVDGKWLQRLYQETEIDPGQ